MANAAAQKSYLKGYIVDIKGDTTRGWVREELPKSRKLQTCHFRGENSGVYADYSASQLKAYGYENGRSLVAISYRKDSLAAPKMIFMEYLVSSKLSLLRNKDAFFLFKSAQLYPLVTKDKEVQSQGRRYIKTTLVFQDVIHNLIKPECPDLLYRKSQMIKDELIDVVKAYNECIKSPYKVHLSSPIKSKNRLHFYVQAGFQQINLTLPTYGQKIDPTGTYFNVPYLATTDNRAYRLFIPAVGVEWRLSRITNRLSLLADVSIFQINNVLNFRFDNYNYQKDFIDGQISHAYTLTRINPAVKYHFNRNLWRFYGKVGAVFYSVKDESSNLTQAETSSINFLGDQRTTTTSNNEVINVSKKPFGLTAALGVDIPGLKHLGGFAELKTENMSIEFTSNPTGYYWKNTFSAVSFNLGVRF
ncbi:MAG: hypothetical protein EAZ70_11385 [Runella slithyformis]|nr:MAG: hypothetical protein EAY79_12165 [Runella slithyformis]TAF24706.1 MAG: hypothetical protein EAZ70_11385 [Runella slithyformis]TAF49566.1 MAG: hypothetical protein EAZ63_00885 [Runella slithyformis]TAF96645.1 MAG: hypothetical protein EAZ46_04755 [Runella sp.]TAG40135.1 MAG: hypothetical protein EAZ32_07825 [Cytophagia bacterium]